jgi:BirA family biotin operon repressor/biotin-[acetyl-CoA-carboxylase] ligase
MNSTTYKTFTIHEFEELESTNKTAFEMAALGKIFDSEIILAKKQTTGKGRKNRDWSSPMGNLYFSLVLQPKINLEKISLISFVAAVVLRLALEEISGRQKVSLKWPNDLLINDKKCGGILLESKINQKDCEFLILGIGVNIDSNPDNVMFEATNLKDLGIEITAENFLKKFLNHFEIIYKSFLDYGFAGVRQLWLQSAYKLQEKVILKIDDEEVSGVFVDLDDLGRLVLQQGNVDIKISVADVS